MKFQSYAAGWLDRMAGILKPATITTFRSHIRKLDGDLNMTEISAQEIVSRLASELSPRSVRNYWSTVNLILNRAKKEGLIQNIPEPELPRGGSGKQPFFSLTEMRKLARLNTLWFVLAETGIRAGEVSGLRIEDCDIMERELTINRSIFNGKTQLPKSANSVRALSISVPLARELQEIIGGRKNGFVFAARNGSPKNMSYCLSGELHPDCERSGIQVQGFHSFRRGSASALMSMGAPLNVIASRLGHSGGVTMGYCQTVRKMDAEWAERLGKELHAGDV